MPTKLQPYHLAWLTAHPDRTVDWLRFVMKAGFDIHHLDGDHDNNSPDNLVLIEHQDHMRLHGAKTCFRRELEVVKSRRKKKFLQEGKRAYETALKVRQTATYSGGIWIDVGRESGVGHKSHARARLWATENGLEWPLLMPKRARPKRASA
jgi:hypothetical protein